MTMIFAAVAVVVVTADDAVDYVRENGFAVDVAADVEEHYVADY